MKWADTDITVSQDGAVRIQQADKIQRLLNERNEALELLDLWTLQGPCPEFREGVLALLGRMRAEPAKIERLQTDTDVYCMPDLRDTINKLVDKVNAL